MRIFVDASALISLYNPVDSNHGQAVRLANNYKQHTFIISDYVFSEVVTVLCQRRGRKTAVEVGEHLKDTYVWTDIDQEIERLAWDIFKKQRSKNVGFVDCTTFALYEKEIFDKAFAFDDDFKKNNIPLV